MSVYPPVCIRLQEVSKRQEEKGGKAIFFFFMKTNREGCIHLKEVNATPPKKKVASLYPLFSQVNKSIDFILISSQLHI